LTSGCGAGTLAGVKHSWSRSLAALVFLSGPLAAQEQPPAHTQPPPVFGRLSEQAAAYAGAVGLSIERDQSPRDLLDQQRRLAHVLDAVQPQRAGTVDAYVVAVALDSDPVFAREAREAGRVLARRYDAAGRTIVLAGADGRGGEALPTGTPQAIAAALARVAEVMDRQQDVLVLYTTSHGAPWGIVYDEGDQGFGAIGPKRLRAMLDTLGIGNRVLLISACFSGAFVPELQSSTTVVVTASSADRTSFGCQSDNDWTFFGDALINHALRGATPLGAAAAQARAQIGRWEQQGGITPSKPQISVGRDTARWLTPLEARLPPADAPVGRPSIESLDKAKAHNH